MSVKDQFGSWKTFEGFAFRVWAPHADSVSVIGDFNGWEPTNDPMHREDSGCWYAEIRGADFEDQYRYEIRRGQESFSRIDPYAISVTNSVGNAILTNLHFDWQGDNFKLAPINELVIYELHVGTFNVKVKGKPSGFTDVIDRLDHLVKLGINAIEIMPCAEFAGDLSWGYNPAHIFAVENAYGGPVALKQLIYECHRRKIGVILDVVYNHFGPSDLSLWRFDGWQKDGKGGIYFYNDWRSSTPWGDTRPDYGRQEVRRFIIDNAKYWLEEFHVDGLRFDMTLYIRNVTGNGDPSQDIADGWSLVQAINKMVETDYPGRITIAEDLQNSEWITKAVGDGGAGFSIQWDAQFVHPIRKLVCAPLDSERSIADFLSAATASYNGNPFQRVIYSESHDEVANGKARVTTEINADDPQGWNAKKRSTLAAAMAMTVPGVPMLFQGQEFLEDEWFRDTDPIDWALANEHNGVVLMYRDLINLRRNTEGFTKGLTGSGFEVLYEHNDQRAIVYRRWYSGGPGDDVVVLMNLSKAAIAGVPVTLPSSGKWHLKFNSDWTGYSTDFGNYSASQFIEVSDASGEQLFRLAPYSLQIYISVPGDHK